MLLETCLCPGLNRCCILVVFTVFYFLCDLNTRDQVCLQNNVYLSCNEFLIRHHYDLYRYVNDKVEKGCLLLFLHELTRDLHL